MIRPNPGLYLCSLDSLERGPLSDGCSYISYEGVRELARETNLEYLSDRVLEKYEEASEEESE